MFLIEIIKTIFKFDSKIEIDPLNKNDFYYLISNSRFMVKYIFLDYGIRTINI